MKVARWLGQQSVVVAENPIPTAMAHEALVRVALCGLCGSDFEEYDHGPIVAVPGVVLGHEIVGIVEVPASDGTGPPQGSRVVVDVVTGCGECYFCKAQNEGLCDSLRVSGQHVDGGLAEFVVARADRLLPVPEQVSLETAVFTEPLAVVVRALRKASYSHDSKVLIVGGGTIGLLAVQVLISQGLRDILLIEPDSARRALGTDFGAASFWGVDNIENANWIKKLTQGQGADLVLECSGVPTNVAFGIESLAKAGTLLLLGVTRMPSTFISLAVVAGEKSIRGSSAHMWDTDCSDALDILASGVVHVQPLISARIALAEVHLAFDALRTAIPPPIKILVAPQEPPLRDK